MTVKHTDEETSYLDHYDPDALHDILDAQRKITQVMKHSGDNILQILIIDEFVDGLGFTRQLSMLHTLYIRGHHMISTITATQKFNALHSIIRVNATELCVYRLRNMKDLDTFIDAVSAVLDKTTLWEMYNTATVEPYSFLYVKLTAKHKDDMFLSEFTTDE